jgi:hypothetical protein
MRRACASCDSTSLKLNSCAPVLAMTTISRGGCNKLRQFLKNSLTRRFTRLRWTAPPMRLVTVIPILEIGVRAGVDRTTKCGVFAPRRTACTRRYSLRLRSRASLGKRPPMLPMRPFGRRRHGQPLATLGATALDDGPATGCGHTGAEAMASTTFQVTWLVGSFHGNRSSKQALEAVRRHAVRNSGNLSARI